MKSPITEITAQDTLIDPVTSPDAKQTSHPRMDSASIPAAAFSEGMPAPSFSRLIVLVPDRDVDEVAFAHKVWSILGRQPSMVLLVSLVSNGSYGPGAQRRLITLAAVAQEAFYQIETRVVFGSSWISGLKAIVQPGDLIVCHDAQQSRSFLREEVALADRIVSELDRPVYVLSGLYSETVHPQPSRLLRQMVLWGVLIGIISIFFIFEADIQNLTSGTIKSALFILVFGVELLFIWLWNYIRV
jgi:hypothetical protein